MKLLFIVKLFLFCVNSLSNFDVCRSKISLGNRDVPVQSVKCMLLCNIEVVLNYSIKPRQILRLYVFVHFMRQIEL